MKGPVTMKATILTAIMLVIVGMAGMTVVSAMASDQVHAGGRIKPTPYYGGRKRHPCIRVPVSPGGIFTCR